MKNFNLKNYGIDDLSKESFEIKKINLSSYNKVYGVKRYIIIDKKTNQEIKIFKYYDERPNYYKTFKKALLAILRVMGRIDNIEHNKCEKFYNYQQDKDSFKEFYKNNTYENDMINNDCFLNLLKYYNGHMSKTIKKFIDIVDNIENPPEYICDFIFIDIGELLWYQIPHRYYKDKYFIKNIPKYAKLISKEIFYIKEKSRNYKEQINNKEYEKIKNNTEYYKKILYRMVEKCKKK